MPSVVHFERISFLIVENNPHMIQIVRSILIGFGVTKIFEAVNGVEGMKMLVEHEPDIVILDWEMPELNGAEMMQIIRQIGKPYAITPVILLTAHSSKNVILKAQKLGINEVLRKPVSPKGLYQRISAIVLQPRPFVKGDNYFGPEPRTDIE